LQASITVLPWSARAGQRQRLLRNLSSDRKDHNIAERRRFRERFDCGAWIFRSPLPELSRIARSNLNLMAVFYKTRRQRLSDHARTNDSDFH
jgi:hypothetical protein